MNIGVIGSFYNCADLLPEVLAPWVALKQQGAPLVLTAINAQFKEYAELGYKNDDEETQVILKEHAQHFDLLHIDEKPLSEVEVRNIGLNYLLEQKVDLIWILDGDEVYTEEQIKGIVDYIEKTPQFTYYHLYFNNQVFGMPLKDTFAPPRIFRTARRGGIKEFKDDNTVQYNDGKELYNSIPGMMPRTVAHILHHTWQKKDAVDKINYHRKHFGFCPYTYNTDTKSFGFDESYFKMLNFPVPQMHDGYMELIPLKPVRIVLNILDTIEETANEIVIKTLEALLCIERENSYEIHLTVVTNQEYFACLKTFLDLCPFETELTTTPLEQKVDVYLEAQNLPTDTQELLTYIRGYL